MELNSVILEEGVNAYPHSSSPQILVYTTIFQEGSGVEIFKKVKHFSLAAVKAQKEPNFPKFLKPGKPAGCRRISGLQQSSKSWVRGLSPGIPGQVRTECYALAAL